MDELSDIEMTEADYEEAASGIKDSDDGPQGYEEGEPDEETAGAEGEVERSETRSTGVVEASWGGFPTTDVAARDVLLRHAGERWKCVQGETLWVYEDGVWVEGESAFMRLIGSYKEALGPKYGEMHYKMRSIKEVAKLVNVVPSTWTRDLDQLKPGDIPFSDKIFNAYTMTSREYTPDDMVSVKLDWAAPTEEELHTDSAAKADVEAILSSFFPQEDLYDEVVSRIAESLFNSRNEHKYLVQLYGRGNNGKTTLMPILQGAFPALVKMPSVENLLLHGKPTDPNGPRPWLTEVMGARLVCFEEPPSGCHFDGSLLKLLRGNGVVTGRQLHCRNVSYTPTFTLYIAANEPISIKPLDEAIKRSLHSWQLPSYFGNDAPLGTEYQFPKRNNVEREFLARPYRIELLKLLARQEQKRGRSGDLPPMQSRFTLKELYEDEAPSFDQLFDQAFELSEKSKLKESRMYDCMKRVGFTESKMSMAVQLERKFGMHRTVSRTRPKNIKTWHGIKEKEIEDEYQYHLW